MDTMLDIAGTEGYGAATVERVCAAAGVSPRHLYELFPNREALFGTTYQEIIDDGWAQMAAGVGAAGPDLTGQVRLGLSAFIHAYCDDPRRGRVACVEIVGVSPELEALRRSVLRDYAQYVTDAAGALGIVAPADRVTPHGVSLTAMGLVGACNEVVVEVLSLPEAQRPSLETVIDTLTELFLQAAQVVAP